MNFSPESSEERFTGLPISDGVAQATVHVMRKDRRTAVPYYRIRKEDLPKEKDRLLRGFEQVADHLDALAEKVSSRIGAAQANIFTAQKSMVQDPMLHEKVHALMEEQLLNAEAALEQTMDKYEAALADLADDYLKERASDIGELRFRLLEALCGASGNAANGIAQLDDGQNHIIVAEELTPSETVVLDTIRTVGFITERGGTASHAAILARALGIPAVSGVKEIYRHIPEGEEVLLNGNTGEVVLRPRKTTSQRYPAARTRSPRQLDPVEPIANYPVMANIGLAGDVDSALKMKADGVGLYRTEFEMLAAGKLLNEEEQYERYATVVKKMKGRPVFARLLDLGGDKAGQLLALPNEENPCLGYRGARMLLGNPELLTTQARALCRASAHGPIHVLYPMISDLVQFLRLRELFMQSVEDIPCEGMQHGVMFEVPAACLDAENILQVADFGSVGTNDLIQYLFAVDRNNDLVAQDYSPDKPAFWRLLSTLSGTAAKLNKKLSVCGEMGWQPQFLPKLIAVGFRQVSVNPGQIGLVRQAIRQTRQQLAEKHLT